MFNEKKIASAGIRTKIFFIFLNCTFIFTHSGFSVKFYLENHIVNNFFEPAYRHRPFSMSEKMQKNRKSSTSFYGKIRVTENGLLIFELWNIL